MSSKSNIKVHRPMEWQPELATGSSSSGQILSKQQQMMAELGLDHGSDNSDEEEGNWGFGNEANKSSNDALMKQLKDAARWRSEAVAEIKELKQQLNDLSEKSSLAEQRFNEQVATIKQLADSRTAIMKKRFEERLQTTEQEIEDLQNAVDAELKKSDVLRGRTTQLEALLQSQGLSIPQPPADMQQAMDRDVERRLNRKIQRLQVEITQLRTQCEQKDVEVNALQIQVETSAKAQNILAENQKLQQTVENLMKANDSLTKISQEKFRLLQEELENVRRQGGGGGGSSTPNNNNNNNTNNNNNNSSINNNNISNNNNGQLSASATPRGITDDQAAKLKEALTQRDNEIRRLQAQIAANGSKSPGNDEGSVELKSQLSQLSQQLQQKDAANNALKAQYDQACGKISVLEKELERQKKAGGDNAALRNVLVSKLKQQKSDLKNLRESFTQLQTAVAAQKNEIFPSIKWFYSQLKKQLDYQTKALASASDNYKKEMRERKRLFNLIQELKGNIRVYCRVRPILPHEQARGELSVVAFPGENEVAYRDEEKLIDKTFEFEKVFEPTSKQDEVFNELEGLITSVMDGYNVCIFAYGQTGSGKTHTMEGSSDNPGVNPRALERLFQLKNEREREYEYVIQFSIMEIYIEEIRDLLSMDGRKKPDIRQGPNGIYVQDLTVVDVNSAAEVRDLWKKGSQFRASASNNVNEHSSRSHLILQLQIQGINRLSNTRTYSKLNLIDLAGSERVSRTQSSGDRLEEAKAINTSLSALGNCIHAISSKDSHVSFRSNKLTYLLQDSLNGESKTLMIVQVSPSKIDLMETISSLQFASRARATELGQAKKNVLGGAGGGTPPTGQTPRTGTTPRPKTAK